MIWMAVAALAVGLLVGFFTPSTISGNYTVFMAVAIFAMIDTFFGGLRAYLNRKFEMSVFLSGFVGNIFLAIVLTYLGVRMDLDIYIAVIVVFGTRVFNNFAEIRRFLLNSKQKNDIINKIEQNSESTLGSDMEKAPPLQKADANNQPAQPAKISEDETGECPETEAEEKSETTG